MLTCGILLANCKGVALVDEADYDRVAKYSWCLNSEDYARRRDGKTGKNVQMQNFILGKPPANYMWDHRDGNRLNNIRSNLRIATRQENGRNSKKRPECKSRYKGVVKQKSRWRLSKPWNARIRIAEKRYSLGVYATEEQAARAYDEAARLHFGEFACLNYPDAGERSCLLN